jgi:hypothetical protein
LCPWGFHLPVMRWVAVRALAGSRGAVDGKMGRRVRTQSALTLHALPYAREKGSAPRQAREHRLGSECTPHHAQRQCSLTHGQRRVESHLFSPATGRSRCTPCCSRSWSACRNKGIIVGPRRDSAGGAAGHASHSTDGASARSTLSNTSSFRNADMPSQYDAVTNDVFTLVTRLKRAHDNAGGEGARARAVCIDGHASCTRH